MGEKVSHPEPMLSIVVRGTIVRGGKPFGKGECIGEDVLLRSQALRDRRTAVALTYCEICCLTKEDIDATAQSHPTSARHLRFEAFKIAMCDRTTHRRPRPAARAVCCVCAESGVRCVRPSPPESARVRRRVRLAHLVAYVWSPLSHGGWLCTPAQVSLGTAHLEICEQQFRRHTAQDGRPGSHQPRGGRLT
jgi:hypothetical protein